MDDETVVDMSSRVSLGFDVVIDNVCSVDEASLVCESDWVADEVGDCPLLVRDGREDTDGVAVGDGDMEGSVVGVRCDTVGLRVPEGRPSDEETVVLADRDRDSFVDCERLCSVDSDRDGVSVAM